MACYVGFDGGVIRKVKPKKVFTVLATGGCQQILLRFLDSSELLGGLRGEVLPMSNWTAPKGGDFLAYSTGLPPMGGLPGLFDWVAPDGGTSWLIRLGCPQWGSSGCGVNVRMLWPPISG